MQKPSSKSNTHSAIIFALLLGISGCGRSSPPTKHGSQLPQPPPVAAISVDSDATLTAVRFLEERVKRDPDDVIAHNRLAVYYLKLNRETGDVKYLELASGAAHASLAILPADQNLGGLSALAESEYATHQFASARDHARELTEYEPEKSTGHRLLCDALLELGDYEGARAALNRMRQIEGSTVATESRLARFAMLHGNNDEAARRYTISLNLALAATPVARETVAWCRWQLGETAFAVGDYKTAEQHYKDALVTFPDYHPAHFSLARARAALGDHLGAIEQMEDAVRRQDDLAYVAALGDLYKLSDRNRDAATQYELVERLAQSSALNARLHNREFALFQADHDLKTDEAYGSTKKEYETRRDIYGADALAWTALKAGRIDEARAAIKEALRLGTRDAKLFYHAGMIAAAARDPVSARDYIQRALKLNPEFDPLQVITARKMLGG